MPDVAMEQDNCQFYWILRVQLKFLKVWNWLFFTKGDQKIHAAMFFLLISLSAELNLNVKSFFFFFFFLCFRFHNIKAIILSYDSYNNKDFFFLILI